MNNKFEQPSAHIVSVNNAIYHFQRVPALARWGCATCTTHLFQSGPCYEINVFERNTPLHSTSAFPNGKGSIPSNPEFFKVKFSPLKF